ncbi:Ig-specific serine endopeptidase MIP [Mycoplasmopsis alligatoris]|uniref:Lipofamily protein n=1 Tax=Mycoplasmopsis alligatoris A21JP2 TaxID=747682 RepID=D4XVB6_9BACT|nr:DUF31 family protein [Mycoplasmopsis alligatoris]EFF41625.1 lipofamily protein [Mycoplasmopsis alligatoris A21JP2]
MKFKKKNILTLISVGTLLSVSTLFVACSTPDTSATNNGKETEKQDGKNEKLNSGVANNQNESSEFKDLNVDIEYKAFEPIPQLYANETTTFNYQPKADEKILKDYDISIIGLLNPSAKNGTVEVKYRITSKKDNTKFIEKTKLITGFMTNPFDKFRGEDISSNDKLNVSEKYKYASKTRLQRFDEDNERYMNLLRRQRSSTYTENNLKPETIKELNEMALKNNQDTFENATYKGFSLPFYDETTKKATGLSVNKSGETGKGPSKVDSYSDQEFAGGLARTLPNEIYKKIGLQTFSLYINNHESGNKYKANYGTTWILDYQKREDNKYPTKWYFATNVHVAETMRLKDEPLYKTRTGETTKTIQFLRLKPDTGIRTTLKTSAYGDMYENFAFDTVNSKNESAFKTIYMGLNFLKTSPKDYLEPNSPYKDTEEYADVAIFELDFEKIDFGSVTVATAGHNNGKKYTSAEELAKDMTNNYANTPDAQIKFIKNSYLKDYDKIAVPFANNPVDPVYKKNPTKEYDSLFALGYPVTWSGSFLDYFLDQYADEADLKAGKTSVSLWVNGRRGWYGKMGKSETSAASGVDEKAASRGNYLSTQIGYRSFIDKPGITDMLISSPVSGYHPFEYQANESKKTDLPEEANGVKKPDGFKNRYLKYGIDYMLRHFTPGGGASGTSVRNQNNEVAGIIHTVNPMALVALADAFRSEGVDYGGYYGPYEMEQYDLIYGGGKNQRFSYREALKEIYKGKKITTNLLPNGLEKENIPEDFKFKDKVKSSYNPENN